MWKKEKIEKQKDYFKRQRVDKTGYFTEFVVRTFYCIYKACDYNKVNYCLRKDVTPIKIRYNIYEGIYDGIPDHDYYNIINDCFHHLCEMGYIQYETICSQEIIVIKKQLDFLLKNEHKFYLKKYDIQNDIYLENTEIKLENIQHKVSYKTDIKCVDCKKGFYVLRKGPYHSFYGCSHFPKCKSTKNIADFISIYLEKNGLNLYEKRINCWKCGKQISVFSYFLDLDFKLNKVPIDKAVYLDTVRLGMFKEIDFYLSNKYSTIEERFSKKAGFSYVANICPHCNSLQGGQMALGKVYNSLLKDLSSGTLESKIKEKIPVDENLLPKETIQEIVRICF